MPNLYDICFAVGLAATSPFWLVAPKARRKVLRALRERTGRDAAAASKRDLSRPAVLIHAVSLGEMNATRALVKALADARPDLQITVSVTTDTGFARGSELYGDNERVTLVRFPLDFSRGIKRILDTLRPTVVVLMELEVWPNFVLQCTRRSIPVLLVNGRLTKSSYRNYRRARPLLRRTFARLAAVCAQDEIYAKRFVDLGVVPDRLHVTGTMKFDTSQIARSIHGAEQLAGELGFDPSTETLWVAGSTGPGEEEIVLRQYWKLLQTFPRLRLAIIPRHPERFDEVAELIVRNRFNLTRRSGKTAPDRLPPEENATPIFLGDTMGELRKFYSLANVVFVARTLIDLGPRQHGSDMIEPAALGKAVIVGPFTGNFADVMDRFRAADAISEVSDEAHLGEAVRTLLLSPDAARQMGNRAQAVVGRSQGATARHAGFILDALAAIIKPNA